MTMIVPAPAARAMVTAIRPMMPTPVMSTLRPLTPAAMTVCMALPSGSKIAAMWSGMFSWTGQMFSSGTETNSREAAVAVDAEDIDLLADVAVARAAGLAEAAADVPFGADALADRACGRPRCRSAATRPTNSCPVVMPSGIAALAPGVPFVDMPVGAADAGVRDRDQHVARADFGHGRVGTPGEAGCGG